MDFQPGRRFFGAGSIAFGIITLLWHQIHSLANIPLPGFLVYVVGIAELAGGFALQWERSVRIGSALIGAVFSYLHFNGCRGLP